LEPRFIHFEDPEYNRRLSSASGHASRSFQARLSNETEEVLFTVKFSVDRRAYNPDSDIAFRFDWQGDFLDDVEAFVRIQRVDQDGIVTNLMVRSAEAQAASPTFGPGVLRQFSLLDLWRDLEEVEDEADDQILPSDTPDISNDTDDSTLRRLALKPGDAIRLTLVLTNFPADEDQRETVELTVSIVAEPVIPAAEAAYALLRHQTIQGVDQVECVRFAWGPEASRIELICPDDLTTEIVRRRAVFQWADAVRAETLNGYAIQKITESGSTHFPEFGKVIDKN
jgi:hypothetical protein